MKGLYSEWWGSPGQDRSGVGVEWGPDKKGRDRLWGLGRGYEEGSWISCRTGQLWLGCQQTVLRSLAIPSRGLSY